MADAIFRRGDGIIEMNATNSDSTSVTPVPAPVTSIIVTGATAGSFSVKLNHTTFVIITTTLELTKQLFIRMAVNTVELTAEPSGGIAYITLDQMP